VATAQAAAAEVALVAALVRAEWGLPAEQVLLDEPVQSVKPVVWLDAADPPWGSIAQAMAVTSHVAEAEEALPVQTSVAAQVGLPETLPSKHSDSAVQTEIRLSVQPS
jgi:hypothetical protein